VQNNNTVEKSDIMEMGTLGFREKGDSMQIGTFIRNWKRMTKETRYEKNTNPFPFPFPFPLFYKSTHSTNRYPATPPNKQNLPFPATPPPFAAFPFATSVIAALPDSHAA
jgi:hypothetical protein